MTTHQTQTKRIIPRILTCLLLVVCFVTALPIGQAEEDAANLPQRWQTREAEFNEKLEQLARECEEANLTEQAKATRGWVRPQDPLHLYIPKLPRKMRPRELPTETPEAIRKWDEAFWRLRATYSQDLYALAKQAVQAEQTTLAHEVLLEALRQNPDDETLRKLFGFQAYRGEWLTAWQVRQITNGLVWDERFGWIRRTHLPRYENGERYISQLGPSNRLVRPIWVSAEREQELRDEIDEGWVIETEHFRVQTNHSQAEGVRLATELEELHWVWKQLFYRFWTTEAQREHLLRVPTTRRRFRNGRAFKHDIVHFRNRDDYNETLSDATPGDITISTGFYHSGVQKAFFFAGDKHTRTTLLHEATHQLFAETNPRIRAITSRKFFWERRKGNFWIVEGIACYMETLQQTDDFYVLGGFQNDRVAAAIYRRLGLDWHIPIGELTRLNMLEIIKHREIASLYSEATGYTHFLMHGQDGKYRNALFDYLAAVYSGKDSPTSLANLTDTSYPELDEQYKAFLEKFAVGE